MLKTEFLPISKYRQGDVEISWWRSVEERNNFVVSEECRIFQLLAWKLHVRWGSVPDMSVEPFYVSLQ